MTVASRSAPHPSYRNRNAMLKAAEGWSGFSQTCGAHFGGVVSGCEIERCTAVGPAMVALAYELLAGEKLAAKRGGGKQEGKRSASAGEAVQMSLALL